MSAFVEGTTKISDRAALVAALIEMGFSEKHIEIHAEPQNLHGYRGDTRKEKAHVIVRRRGLTGASNDIGFLEENGKFTAIISEFDQRQLAPLVTQRTKSPCKDFVAELTARSALVVAERMAKLRGFKTQRVQTDREIRLVCRK